ncbi:site-specific integrase [Colidextribacter sp. OB.20]|uniref:tyrosine-type recombinase/integrase n=1 Tax=Colidextribacter sp. OB.20 TaxID=2304568 RepID=UPI00136C6BDE|nr:tyrosine-type recombinase/integrase [Colidextribacter sp. OB.20]NBI11217.1 site-specific integrase [Colidextribacter sp. OB.20]
MASIKDLGKGKYRVFICNGFKANGKVNRTSKVITAKSIKDAEKQAKALEVDFTRGHQVQLAHAPTFNDLVEKWREIKKPDMEYKTQERYEGFLNGFMLPYFGNKKVSTIRALDIEAYLNTLKKDGVRLDGKKGGYSEKTIRHHFMFIQTLLNLAVKWDMVEYNPCVKVDTPKVHKKNPGYYEEPEIGRLLECLEDEYIRAVNETGGKENSFSFDNLTSRQCTDIFNAYMRKTYILVALVSACRRGELIGLKVENINFDNNCVLISQTGHYTVENGLYFVDYLKNGSPSKNIDMPVTVMEQLKEYIQIRKAFIDLMDWEDRGYLFISLKTGKVTTAGGPMMPDVISQWFTKFLERNNLPKITLHEVRHTSISYLINKGVDVKMVADRAGHQNTRTTEEVYSHIYAKTRRATADIYNDLFTGKEIKGE